MPVLHLPQLVGLALGPGAQGAGHAAPRRAADVGDRLVDLGRGRRGSISCAVKILTVVGNRPQFIKAAAVSGPLRERARGDAGAHRPALRRLRCRRCSSPSSACPSPTASWGSAAARTPRRRRACSPRWSRCWPRSSPTRCSSTATPTRRSRARSRPRAGAVPVVHVEAGMRSFDRTMPEELNRVLTDHSASCCCAPRSAAAANLRRRVGRRQDRGRRRRDGRRRAAPPARRARGHATLQRLRCQPGEYLLLTAHRAGNVDDPERLGDLVELRQARCRGPVVFPVHPRTRARLRPGRAARPAGRRRRDRR